MELRRCRLTDDVARPLMEGLADEYSRRYTGSDEITRGLAEEFDPPEGIFLVLRDGEITVAGGGFKFLAPGVCEVKRMWTAPEHRRRGHAKTILAGLEAAARDAGYRWIRMETGPNQPEAAALYAQRYRRIDTYGPYPPDLAFEKDLREDVEPPRTSTDG